MATVSPSPNSAPSDVPPTSLATPPPAPSDSTPSGVPPTSSSAPPQPSTSPPRTPSTPVEQPNANPPEPPTPSPPSSPPNVPPPSNSSPPDSPVTPPPVESTPPSTPSAPPPASLPPPPLTVPSPPSNPSSPPPVAEPPAGSPPSTPSPPPSQTLTPPTSSPPQQPVPSPPSSSALPPSSPPPPLETPTPPSSNPPVNPPPPPSSANPPVSSPPPPSSEPPSSQPPPSSVPPRASPSPPTTQPPRSSPSPPAGRPPRGQPPPSRTSPPPPSDSGSSPPPSVAPAPPSPPSFSPPSPGSRATVPSSPASPSGNTSLDSPQTANRGDSGGGIGSGGAVAIGVIAGVLFLGLIGLVAFCLHKRKKRNAGANGGHVIPASIGSSPRSDINLLVKTEQPPQFFGRRSGSETPSDHVGFGHSRPWFTYQELVEATGGFSDKNLLGEGGFGCVYKGILPDGREVAVKQLKVGGSQGEREFRAEVEIISRIHHRHLVSLVGYCIWDSKRLLVYDFVPNDTLHFHLHGQVTSVMDWATRLKIAAGAARGIAYLHEDCHPRIIHRDIKSSNILLDSNFEARVSDFGLAKLALDADTHVSTRVMGTFGYLAPEYATSGKLTEKSDVYSFGVVLLELITGRKPVDESQPVGDESLVEWARPLLTHALDSGELGGLVDPRLEKNFIESEMFRMIEAAAACVRHSAAKRPRMGQVVRALDGISDSGDLSNGLRVGESQLYDSAQQSAEIRWFRRMAFGSQDISTDFFSQPTQNPGFPRQTGHNGNFSSQQSQRSDLSRQQSADSQYMGFSNQSRQNLNVSSQPGTNPGSRNLQFFREDSLNR